MPLLLWLAANHISALRVADLYIFVHVCMYPSHLYSFIRSRSRSPGWSRSRSPAGRRRDYGGSRRDFPRGSRPYHDAGRDVHYEGGGGQRPDVRPDSRRSFDRFNEMSPPSPQYMSRSKHSRSNSPGKLLKLNNLVRFGS